jgi:hypothetical protein
MNALTRLLEIKELPDHHRAAATYYPPAADVFLDIEGAYHGQTFTSRMAEITAAHLKRGISILVPSLTDHPALPNEGWLILTLSFYTEQWQFRADFVDGIYEGETLFIPHEELVPFAGQRMAMDLRVFEPDVWMSLIDLTTFVDLGSPNFMAQVEGAKNGFIDARVAASGSTLLIPPYEGMSNGDEIIIYLLGRQSEGSHVFRVSIEEGAVGQAINVPVHATLLQPSGNSTITIFYRIATAEHTINGPLATFFVESYGGGLVVADATFIDPYLYSYLGKESEVVFTVPPAEGQLAGVEQTLFLWDELEPTRRDYRLDTRSLDGPSTWSSALSPEPRGAFVYTTTWISMGAAAVWAATMDKAIITYTGLPRRGSMPYPPSLSVETRTLEAPTVWEAIDGVVSEEAINAGLTVSAPRPVHLPNGSYLSLLLKGYTGTVHNVGVLTTDDTMLSWKVPREIASLLLNQMVSFHYVVQDGSGMRSEDTVLNFAVQRLPLQILEAEQNNGNIPVISVAAATAGVSVFLPPAPGLNAGDVVTCYWGGSAGKGHFVTAIPWTYEHQQTGLTFQIPPRYVIAHLGGQVVASYTVLALGRVLDGPVSRFHVQPKVESVDVMPLARVDSAEWRFSGQALITLSNRLGLGIGDKVIWYVDVSPKTALSVVAWRFEQVISNPSQPIQVMIPASQASYLPFEVRVFVVRADNEEVSFTSTRLLRQAGA